MKNCEHKLNENFHNLSPAQAEFLARQRARTTFYDWCVQAGYKPATHHRLIIAELQALVDKLVDTLNNLSPEAREKEVDGLRLMILMPPGTAKSTYTSKLFPPWFLAQVTRLPVKELGILGCSHEAGLATEFGAAARNHVEGNERWLGYSLKRDSRAADHWETSKNGFYKAAGVGAGISGRRMHLGLIDDFCGKEEDVNSKTFNDKIYNWYVNDFVPRLQPFAARVIIANHRNEDDLVGRLLQKEPTKWRVIRLRLLIENEEQAEQDPLGRKVGDYIWPEYFSRQQVMERMANPSASGIEQQEPTPQKGNTFQADWFNEYRPDELPALHECRAYGASDHAVRTKEKNDNSCLGIGLFKDGFLYVHPDLVWDRIPTDKAVDTMMRMTRQYKPITWWAEKENISGSIGPFLRRRMQDEALWFNVEEVPHMNRDLLARCQSIIGLMSMGRVRFPAYAPWFKRFKHELLTFPNGKHDDAVSFMAHLGRGIAMMTNMSAKKPDVEVNINQPWVPTFRWLKDGQERKQRALRMLHADN